MIRDVTVILDDDPTGTQEATDVPVLLQRDREGLRGLLREHDVVFVLTNTRALDEEDAVELVRLIAEDVRAIEVELGVRALIVERGDSTMRGHVFAEVDAVDPQAVVLFCPAFPAGGRRTVAGVHEVLVEGHWINAADTEFARDPVFGYRARTQRDYVAEKGRGRTAVPVSVSEVQEALRTAQEGDVVLPDALDDADIAEIAAAVHQARREGVRLIVRCGAPLAAILAGAKSTALLSEAQLTRAHAPDDSRRGLLVVVGSHTGLTGAQLRCLQREPGVVTHELDTAAALADAREAGRELGERARRDITAGRVTVLASARERLAAHHTLAHGEAVMTALTIATAVASPRAAAVVSKGGITSAEVARSGLSRTSAWVAGQLAPGVSVWVFGDGGIRPPGLLYGVVPGNIGQEHTLRDVVRTFRAVTAPSTSTGTEHLTQTAR